MYSGSPGTGDLLAKQLCWSPLPECLKAALPGGAHVY